MALSLIPALAGLFGGEEGVGTDILGAVSGAFGAGKKPGSVIGGTITGRTRGFLQIRTSAGKVITVKTAKRARRRYGRARSGSTTAMMRELMPLMLMSKMFK